MRWNSDAATLADLLQAAAAEHGDRTAYTFLADGERESSSLTYAELDHHARAVAAELQDQGLTGQRAVLSYTTGPDFVVALYACFYAGVTAVPTPAPGATAGGRSRERVQGILGDCAAAAVLVGGDDHPHGKIEGYPLLRTDLMGEAASGSFEPAPVTSDTLAILQYTSGSTSSPRGVMVSHGNALANLASLGNIAGLDTTSEEPQSTTLVSWVPVHHDMGLFAMVLGSLYIRGRAVLMPPSAFLRKPMRWLRAISKYKASISGGPDFAYDMCVRQTELYNQRAELDLRHWQTAFNAAEPVRPRTLERFSQVFAEAGFSKHAFKPAYGLAESTLLVTAVDRGVQPTVHTVSDEALREGRVLTTAPDEQNTTTIVSCGFPQYGLEVRIVNPKTCNLAEPDRVGEIWVRGDSVAQGYWDRPDETTETFQARLASDDSGPYLRTGDLGCLIDGELIVTGRMKDLIVIRGTNYYPQDIEQTVEEVDERFRRGHGAAFSQPRDGEERLVVVQELRAGTGANLEKIIERIRQSVVTKHGLNADRIVLAKPGQVPKTSSGKVQRTLCRQLLAENRLRLVYDEQPLEFYDARPPSPEDVANWDNTTLVAELTRLVGEVLERPVTNVSPDTSLAAAGMDSLRAAQLQQRIEERFGVELDLTDFLPGGNVLVLADMIRGREQAAQTAPGPRGTGEEIVEDNPDDPFPLTGVQQAYLAGRSEDLELGGVACHFYLEFLNQADFDVTRAKKAWQLVVERHDMLRAVLTADGQQRILPPPVECPIHVDDLSQDPDPNETLRTVRDRMSHQVHDPYTWPLYEIRFSLLPEDKICVQLSFDLLPLDGRSLGRILREWGERYQDLTRPTPVEDPTFRDYVNERQARTRKTVERIADDASRQAGELPMGPRLPLATDPAAVQKPQFKRRSAYIEADTWELLKTGAAARDLTPSALLCAAFSEVLGFYNDEQPFTLTVTSFDQSRMRVDPELAGDFTSLLLVSLEPDSEHFEQRARYVGQRLLETFSDNVDGVRLLREHARTVGSKGQSPSPLAPVVFTSLLEDAGQMDWLGSLTHSVSQTPQVWLDHQVLLQNGGLYLVWDAVEELFPSGLLDQMYETYVRLIRSLAERADWKITSREIAGLQSTADQLPEPDPKAGRWTLHRLVEEQARRTPAAEAIVTVDQRFSYRQIINAAGALAHELVGAGLGAGDVVAVVLRKGWEQVPAVLGALQAGAVFVPIDPDVPDERLHNLLLESTARCVITTSHFGAQNTLPQGLPYIFVDEVFDVDRDREPPELPVGGARPEDLAYILYTSGSTGRPKGVAIEHRSAVNTILDINERFAVGEQDRVLALTPLTFDLSIYDIFGLLATGGSLVIPCADRRDDPGHWVELMKREGVSLWNSVPALLQLLLDNSSVSDRDWAEHLRLILLSGDWIPVEFAARLRDELRHTRLVSLGGATEGSIWSVLYEVDEVPDHWASVPYGRAMKGQGAHVLDVNLEPRPTWVTGPLYLSGAGLAREYWGDQEKTNEAFVVHSDTKQKLYRTGDLARVLPDGNLQLLGREDAQIKIRGYRVEPGEVEAALVTHPAISGAVVGAATPTDGARRLVAYVRPSDDNGLSPEDPREHVARKLPRHLVPDAVRVVNDFPLTANGKVDRGALFAGFDFNGGTATEERRQPDTQQLGVDETVLGLIATVAQAPKVTADAQLSDLELTSVDLIRLANMLEDELGSRPRLDQLYRMRHIGDLIRYYKDSGTGGSEDANGVSPSEEDLLEDDQSGGVIIDPREREAFKQHSRERKAHAGSGLIVALPEPDSSDVNGEALLGRRSERTFAAEPVDSSTFSAWLSCLREYHEDGRTRRAWPSAGDLYPIRVYLQIDSGSAVAGLAKGIYYYEPSSHTLELLAHDPYVGEEHHWPHNQDIARQAAFTLFFVADLDSVTPIYGELAERFCYIEAGAMTQLLSSHAPPLGLGVCSIGDVDFTAAARQFSLHSRLPLVHTLVGGQAADTRHELGSASSATTNGQGVDHPVEHGSEIAPQTSLQTSSNPSDLANVHAVSAGDLSSEVRVQLPHISGRGLPEIPPKTVLVTGSTGFVGALIVSELLDQTDADVYCLVRALNAESARRRVLSSLENHGLRPSLADASRVVGVVGDLVSPRLGLQPCDYERLTHKVDAVYHSGARVDWLSPRQDLTSINVDGTSRVLHFVATGKRKRLVYTSTMAVFPFGGDAPLREDSSLDHGGLLYGGYPQSKWLAEKLVWDAVDQEVDAMVLRPGTVTGSTRSGVFNSVSFLDVILKGCIELGWAPELDMVLDMSPVDYVAAASVALSLNAAGAGKAYHLTNPNPASLATAYDVIEELGYPLRREPFESWKARILQPEILYDNALAPFASYLVGASEQFLRTPPYDCSRTLRALPVSGPTCPPVGTVLLRSYLDTYLQAGFIPSMKVES